MEFEWDAEKGAENFRKHKVPFTEAATIFGDPLGTTVRDPDHSSEENRFITIGLSNRFRLLMVSHIDRGAHVRIISARRLTGRERKEYEEETQG